MESLLAGYITFCKSFTVIKARVSTGISTIFARKVDTEMINLNTSIVNLLRQST